MENTLAVVKTLFSMYQKTFRRQMDEMKMHKLMYFAQRESLIVQNELLFEEGGLRMEIRSRSSQRQECVPKAKSL